MNEQRMISYLSNGSIQDHTVQKIRAMSADEIQALDADLEKLEWLLANPTSATVQSVYVSSYHWMISYIRSVPEIEHRRRIKTVQALLKTTNVYPLEYLNAAYGSLEDFLTDKELFAREYDVNLLLAANASFFLLQDAYLVSLGNLIVDCERGNNQEERQIKFNFVSSYRYLFTLICTAPKRADIRTRRIYNTHPWVGRRM